MFFSQKQSLSHLDSIIITSFIFMSSHRTFSFIPVPFYVVEDFILWIRFSVILLLHSVNVQVIIFLTFLHYFLKFKITPSELHWQFHQLFRVKQNVFLRKEFLFQLI